jgi:glyoxylase-like metal-dependent hydrolase (beta-lactamase superfamily II)
VTEPPAVARELEEVVPGLYHWQVENENIGGGLSSSHALRDDDTWVLVDPVPLLEEALDRLEPVSAIILTAATHQRSAWRYRRRFGARVWLPEGSRETDEEPDEHYGAGELLAGSLRAIQTPGPELPHYSLFRERDPRVLFSPDLVMEADEGRLAFVPGRFHEDPSETRRSVERSLELEFEILCLAHGAPITEDPKRALRELLDRTG